MNVALRRALVAAGVAALGLFAFYVTVLALVSGRDFARSQVRQDGGFLLFLLPGFGAQIGLFTYIRAIIQGPMGKVATAAGASGTMSGASMIACCAHYLPTLLPFVGISAFSTLVIAWRTPLLVLAVLANMVGLAVSIRTLRKVRAMHRLHAPVPAG